MTDDAASIRAGQGRVEVTGTVRVAEQSFTSPLTEQRCVAYRFEKEASLPAKHRDRHEGERRRTTWQTVSVEEASAPFYVEDGGERVLVDGSTADLDMERSYAVETDDLEAGVGERLLATVTGRERDAPEEEREVAGEYVEEIRSASNPRRYTEWLIHEGEDVRVRGAAVPPEQTPIGSSLDAGVDGPTEPVSGGLFGTVKGALGLADEVPADPRARYKPRAIERLPESEEPAEHDDEQAAEVWHTVGMFEGAAEGELSENPDAVQYMLSEARSMTPEEMRVADEAMPDAPALDGARVVISWGDGSSEFVVSDAV
jgi:hypothetical protein